MRLNLRLTENTEPVPFNHLDRLRGVLHRWLGPDNPYHDGLSLYSFGWLNGATPKDGALTFPEGANWRLSFHEVDAAESVIQGILADDSVAYGMSVREVREQSEPAFGEQYRFQVDSPVLVRQSAGHGTRKHLLWNDPEADRLMTRTLQHKLKAAGRDDDAQEVNVQFDRDHDGARSKLVQIKDLEFRASVCPVIIKGSPEVVQFAWTVGVGDLTGSGFGALK